MPCQTQTPPDVLTTLIDRQDIFKAYEKTPEKVTWCGGCGNYSIQKALMRALTLENVKPHEVLLCFDIGCNGNGADKIGAYTIHGLHGRVISLASGAALANSDLPVIAMAGDGATFSEGVGHLVHAVRSDYPITFIFHNNANYGLTTGQASAMTRRGYPMNGSPDGVVMDPINAAELVFSLGPSFVARSFSGDTQHVSDMIRAGMQHPGFSFVEILQVCPTYNKATPQEWYWDRIKHLPEDYPANDLEEARRLALDMDNEINVGVLYQRETVPFPERLLSRQGKSTPLTAEVGHVDITTLLDRMK